MKKFGMVLGAAAVAVVAGCKDPSYNRAGAGSQNAPRDAAPVETAEPAAPQPVAVVEPSCSCPPGTRHEAPCACGAADCACVVTPKPVKAKPAEPEFTVYVVQNGDYLAKISKRFNVTIASIKRINSLKTDTIRIGQKLKIPGKVDVGEQKAAAAAPAAKKAPASFSGATKEYVVKGGDTLGGIAHSYGVNSRQLKDMNGLSSDVIRVGQKLKVPAEKVVKADKKPAAKPTAAAKAEPAKPAATPAAEKKPAESAPAADAKPAAEPPAEPAPVVEAAPAPAAPQTFDYTVKEGEDFTAISLMHGLEPSEIRELNGLGENDVLKAGQVIKLPIEAQQ